ncbi:HDOD domain-containing protein [Tepidimonas charontis]|uniref:HDOD domain protein n=1 Tax=Tepidimonas charontis TaxID=2267262 RepID=A0A554XHH3_9BURK|nr:HDOD domain-containing protein [Tepidimonas charontis]TSE35285.1 HDOD domain protein [Tepidimonas charontis]
MQTDRDAHVEAELEQARTRGPVRDIVIPPCPELLRQLQAATAHGDPDPAELERIASSDVAMAAALIRQANSPLYGLKQPVHTVGQALTVLGQRPAVQLLTGFLTRQALHVNSLVLAHFWESSTRRAIACEHIGLQLYDMDPGLAYSFGLFCHVGLPVLLRGVRGYASTIAEALARKDRTFTETENANHRTDHAVVGAIVARTWWLPAAVAVAIRLHHDFTCLNDPRTSETVRHLVAMGLIADHLVQQHEGVPVARDWLTYGPACLSHLQVGEAEVELWIDALHPAFEAVSMP